MLCRLVWLYLVYSNYRAPKGYCVVAMVGWKLIKVDSHVHYLVY